MQRIGAKGIALDFDPVCGVIDSVTIEWEGQTLRPLHKAPWTGSGEVLPEHIAPVERRLAGDFFCAPFGRSNADTPIHGWSANGLWSGVSEAAGEGTTQFVYALDRPISGANLTKSITLRDGHPIVYQSHVFAGGAGRIPVAHHAMIRVPGGARLSFSPKAGGNTMPAPLESDPARGRSLLAYPQAFASLSAVRAADGGSVDARNYPFDSRHEDLIVLTERAGNPIGWSAAVAPAEGFLFFALKDAAVLPQTILWMSNGGRSYSPWNGRHDAVLGIEEAAAAVHLAPGETSALPTALDLDALSLKTVRYAFGAIPVPLGWTEVSDIRIGSARVVLEDVSGSTVELPFDGSHFADHTGS